MLEEREGLNSNKCLIGNKTPRVDKLLLTLSPPEGQAREAITLEHLKILASLEDSEIVALDYMQKSSEGPDSREYPDPNQRAFMRKRWLQLRVLVGLHRLLLYGILDPKERELFGLSFACIKQDIKKYQKLTTEVRDGDLEFAKVFIETLKRRLDDVVTKVDYFLLPYLPHIHPSFTSYCCCDISVARYGWNYC